MEIGFGKRTGMFHHLPTHYTEWKRREKITYETGQKLQNSSDKIHHSDLTLCSSPCCALPLLGSVNNLNAHTPSNVACMGASQYTNKCSSVIWSPLEYAQPKAWQIECILLEFSGAKKKIQGLSKESVAG